MLHVGGLVLRTLSGAWRVSVPAVHSNANTKLFRNNAHLLTSQYAINYIWEMIPRFQLDGSLNMVDPERPATYRSNDDMGITAACVVSIIWSHSRFTEVGPIVLISQPNWKFSCRRSHAIISSINTSYAHQKAQCPLWHKRTAYNWWFWKGNSWRKWWFHNSYTFPCFTMEKGDSYTIFC